MPSSTVKIELGKDGQSTDDDAILTKLIHVGDTPETLAIAYAQELNRGYTSVWASASGSVVTIYARAMGSDSNHLTLSVPELPSGLTVTITDHLSGGVDGEWRTDLTASPRLNRAVRDWTLSYLTALHGYGIDAACAFSMELQHGDPSPDVGIAQSGDNSGDPVLLPKPLRSRRISHPPASPSGKRSTWRWLRFKPARGCNRFLSIRRSAMVVLSQRWASDTGS